MTFTVHLTDFDTFDINVGNKAQFRHKSVVFGSKYVGVNDCIIPVSDLKYLKSSYEYVFEVNGEKVKKQFDTKKQCLIMLKN